MLASAYVWRAWEALVDRLRSVDLNLLLKIHVLLEERGVGAAARRLGITQPSTSAALDRARRMLGDPLLHRSGRTMRLTPKAEALREPLKRLLLDAGALIGSDQDLSFVRRTVRLCVSDVLAVQLLPTVMRDLARNAPGIRLAVLPWGDGAESAASLARDEADIAVTVLPPDLGSIRRVELFREHYRVVMRAGHPAAGTFGLEAWLGHPHIIVSPTSLYRTHVDDQLALIGRERRIGAIVPGFAYVPALLAATDMIALMPGLCVPSSASFVSLPPPLPMEGFSVHLAWPPRVEGDIAVRHVRRLLQEGAAAMVPAPDTSGPAFATPRCPG
jgi:DNA-binding transcriptional LysR family regulator